MPRLSGLMEDLGRILRAMVTARFS